MGRRAKTFLSAGKIKIGREAVAPNTASTSVCNMFTRGQYRSIQLNKNIKTRRKVVRYIWLIKDASMIRKAHWEGGSTQGAKKSTRPPREPCWALYKAKPSTGPHLATRGCVCLQDGLKRIGLG